MMLETIKDFLARFKGREETLGHPQPLLAATKKPAPTTDSPRITPSDYASTITDSLPVNAQAPATIDSFPVSAQGSNARLLHAGK